jgi:hypothetical protein
MISSEKFAEAVHYLTSVALNIVENYAWLKATIEKQKIDYTCLMRSIGKLEKDNPRNCQNILKLLVLGSKTNVDKAEAKETIEKVRRNILKIRRERKHLIKTYISKI